MEALNVILLFSVLTAADGIEFSFYRKEKQYYRMDL